MRSVELTRQKILVVKSNGIVYFLRQRKIVNTSIISFNCKGEGIIIKLDVFRKRGGKN